MTIGEIVMLGTQVSGVLNKVMDRLPDHEQKVMSEFYAFMDAYKQEIARADSDFDTLIVWRERKNLLLDTIVESLKKWNGC